MTVYLFVILCLLLVIVIAVEIYHFVAVENERFY